MSSRRDRLSGKGRKNGRPTLAQLVASGAGLALLGGYALLKMNSSDIPRDLQIAATLIKVKMVLQRVAKQANFSAVHVFYDAVKKSPEKLALVLAQPPNAAPRRTHYTFAEVDQESNRIAHVAIKLGIGYGDRVALLMDNTPEFVFAWLGLAKVGAVTALINHNLRGAPLKHSFSVSHADRYFVGADFADAVPPELRHELGGSWFMQGCGAIPPSGFTSLDSLLALASTMPVPASAGLEKVKPTDDLWYIYTSGTTGKPKAAKITQVRFLMGGYGFAHAFGVREDDVIYNTLPLYHSAGGMCGTGMSWVMCVPMVIRKKFSASHFFTDCIEHGATVVQYIGEMCRYLMQTPPGPLDRAHKVRLAIGNGMRPEVWRPFQDRFGVATIGEFYAATEGNVGLLNVTGREGACGFLVPLLRAALPAVVVKFDVEREEPIRDPATGLCIRCAAGEVGEMLGFIVQSDPLSSFRGYTDKESTERKVLRDVLRKGDSYFRTGDLMKVDAEGFVYFVDRIGDTFRWKGENVATTEVAEVLNGVPGVMEANVYGVKVPHHDGRAGMASLVVDKSTFDLEVLYNRCRKDLPSYAAPLFLRVQTEMETTSTFKHKKTELVLEGFDPSVIKDPVYVRDDKQRAFLLLTPEAFQAIKDGHPASKL